MDIPLRFSFLPDVIVVASNRQKAHLNQYLYVNSVH